MDVTQLRQEFVKIPLDAPSRAMWQGVVEELERINLTLGDFSNQLTALTAARTAQDAVTQHPPGMCQETTCPVCVAQAQALVEAGRDAMANAIDEALGLIAGEAVRARVAQLVQQGTALREQRGQLLTTIP